jgi:hypothetical protein
LIDEDIFPVDVSTFSEMETYVPNLLDLQFRDTQLLLLPTYPDGQWKPTPPSLEELIATLNNVSLEAMFQTIVNIDRQSGDSTAGVVNLPLSQENQAGLASVLQSYLNGQLLANSSVVLGGALPRYIMIPSSGPITYLKINFFTIYF